MKHLTWFALFATATAFTLQGFGGDSQRVFRLDGGDVTYVVGVNDASQLQTIYWGKRLPLSQGFAAPKSSENSSSFDMSSNSTPQEFTGWGEGLYVEPDLKITFPDGNRDLVLKYASHRASRDELEVVMKDVSREIYVKVQYRIDPATGIVRRSAEVSNRTGAPLTIEQVASGTYHLPNATDYRLHYVTGRWAGEWNLQQQPIHRGKTVLESRRGTTGSQNNPWIMIDHLSDHDQDQGDVWFAGLGWSGSWQIAIEQDVVEGVRVTGGPNAFDFSYYLKNGETFETPCFYGGFSGHGLGGASRLLHRFEVDSLLPNAPHAKLRPILYDSWEATSFGVDEAGQMTLAEKAAKIGRAHV